MRFRVPLKAICPAGISAAPEPWLPCQDLVSAVRASLATVVEAGRLCVAYHFLGDEITRLRLQPDPPLVECLLQSLELG